MNNVVHQVCRNGARRATALAIAAGGAVIVAAPAFAQGVTGGVTYDPTTLANNLLVYLQPLLTVVAITMTIAGCAMCSNNPRAVGGVVGAGVGAIGLIWGLPYAPTAMGVATNALARL